MCGGFNLDSMCKKSRLVVVTIIFLFSLLLGYTIVLGTPTLTIDRERSQILDDEYTLTNTNGVQTLEMPDTTYEVEITSLETNGSSVEIRGFGENGTFVILENVSSIDGHSIVMTLGNQRWYDPEEWNVTIRRQDADAIVSIIATIHYYDPIVVDFAPRPNYGIFGIMFAAICLYYLFMIDRNCRMKNGELNWERKQGPLAIIALVIIGSLLMMPYTVVAAAGAGLPFETWTSTTSRNLQYDLDLDEPVAEIDLENLIENCDNCIIHVDSNMKSVLLIFESENDAHNIATASNIISGYSFSLNITPILNEIKTLRMERIDSNVTVSISIQITHTYTDFNWFVIPYLGLLVMGIIPLSMAVIRARRIDILPNEENGY